MHEVSKSRAESAPLISIVIPTYNYARTLSRAVLSVMPQLDERSELVIVNDGSTDNTEDVLHQLSEAYPGAFTVIYKSNGGSSSARNVGLTQSTGEYLLFLDADDELMPEALSLLIRHIQENPFTRMVIGSHWSEFDDGRKRLHVVKPLPSVARERVKAYLLDKKIALSNGATLMHRDVFNFGNYPERFRSSEDIPVFAQALARVICTTLDLPLAIIHKHKDSLRHNLDHTRAVSLELVDEIFNSQRMPQELMDMKKAFLVQRCLSLSRSFQRAGDTDAARRFYIKAIRNDWRALLKWSYLRKIIFPQSKSGKT